MGSQEKKREGKGTEVMRLSSSGCHLYRPFTRASRGSATVTARIPDARSRSLPAVRSNGGGRSFLLLALHLRSFDLTGDRDGDLEWEDPIMECKD